MASENNGKKVNAASNNLQKIEEDSESEELPQLRSKRLKKKAEESDDTDSKLNMSPLSSVKKDYEEESEMIDMNLVRKI